MNNLVNRVQVILLIVIITTVFIDEDDDMDNDLDDLKTKGPSVVGGAPSKTQK